MLQTPAKNSLMQTFLQPKRFGPDAQCGTQPSNGTVATNYATRLSPKNIFSTFATPRNRVHTPRSWEHTAEPRVYSPHAAAAAFNGVRPLIPPLVYPPRRYMQQGTHSSPNASLTCLTHTLLPDMVTLSCMIIVRNQCIRDQLFTKPA